MLPRKSSEVVGPKASWRVLGIDPGTRLCGFGLLERTLAGGAVALAHGVLRLAPRPMPVRLAQLFQAIGELIEAHRPHVLAIERVFHGKNFQSILKVGEARGVVVLAAQLAGLEVHEYTPAMVKKLVAGNGNASKPLVQRMVTHVLGLKEPPSPFDAADALAIAHCHVLKSRLYEQVAAAEGASPRKRPVAPPARAPLVPAPRGRKGASARLRRSAAGLDVDALLASGKAEWVGGARLGGRRP